MFITLFFQKTSIDIHIKASSQPLFCETPAFMRCPFTLSDCIHLATLLSFVKYIKQLNVGNIVYS